MPIRLLHGSSLMDYHHKIMPFAWCILIDASIFAALLPHRKNARYIHAFGATLVGVISIITSFSSFLRGIPAPGNPMRTHKLTGVLLYLLITSQIIVGILGWLIKSSQQKSEWSLKIKKVHQIIGYLIAIVAKLQVLWILPSSTILFWFNLFWNLITGYLFIRHKRHNVEAQSRPELLLKDATYRTITQLS